MSAGRPIVVRCGALGDMVLLTALVRQLHARFGQPVDIVTSSACAEPLLAGQPGVGEIFHFGVRRWPYLLSPAKRRCVRRLAAAGARPVWFGDWTDAARPMLEHAGITATYVVDCSDHERLPDEHFTDYWTRFGCASPAVLNGARSERVETGCHLRVLDAQRADLESWRAGRGLSGRPIVVVQAGNKRTMRRGRRSRATNTKYWPERDWAETLRELRKRHPEYAFVLIGVEAERALNEEILREAAIEGAVNAAGEAPIGRLIALLGDAEAMITVDTGPAHVAAAVDCPTVALFGKADPTLYTPRGLNSEAVVVRRDLDGSPDMLAIGPSDVLQAWDVLMDRYRRDERGSRRSVRPSVSQQTSEVQR